jgi:C-terminal processing protease CtpA/Prc
MTNAQKLLPRQCRAYALRAALCLALTSAPVAAAERAALAAARESITTSDLKRHVEFLAADALEGREAGSRGGRAASAYLAREFERFGVRPLGGDGTYFQPFHGSCRNVIGVLPGGDPELKEQYIVVCAHYDHVGYGNRRNSNGPTGYIHNGADDNASGVSSLIELLEALSKLPRPARRSIVVALWDSEENGLYGSKHWVANPTVPLANVSAVINLDMVGRLRGDNVEVYGTRTSWGLRRLISQANADISLALDFTWEMTDNSDHWSFYQANLPVVMFHTGLHEDYHRPSDDSPKLNVDGIQRITQLLLTSVLELADADKRQRFRTRSQQEFKGMRSQAEAALSPSPVRLGVRWSNDDDGRGGARLIEVTQGTPAAAAGLRVGDRILEFAGNKIERSATLLPLVLAAENPVAAVVERTGEKEPLQLAIRLGGQPIRVGITWRVDDAEPGVVQVARLTSGSPAHLAGLRVGDRIYRLNGETFGSSDEFAKLLSGAKGATDVEVESSGRIRTVQLTPLSILKAETRD